MPISDIPLFNDDYREVFSYLLDQMEQIISCSEKKEPWYPKDKEKLEEALRVYKRYRPDLDHNLILNFPWPKPGEIPAVPSDYLQPNEEEKMRIKAFIDENDGPDTDPMTKMIVQLAKELILEIH